MSSSIDAWGLEKVQLNIARLQGADPGDTVEIRLQGTGLRVEPSVVLVSASSGATAEVRSRGLGRGLVTAQGPAYVDQLDVPITMTPPWLFLTFALVGGLIGALAREALRDAGGSWRGRAVQVIAVALMAVLLAIGTALGFNLVDLPLPTGKVSELLVLVEAGVFAFAIDPVFDRLGGRKKGEAKSTGEHEPASRQPA